MSPTVIFFAEENEVNATSRNLLILTTISLLILGIGCSDRDPVDSTQARATIDPVVFDDAYSPDVYFQAFFGTHYEAVKMDSVYAYGGYAPDGARSLKITVPSRPSALGVYSGGVLTSAGARDLADFNALTFYARADSAMKLNVAGFGNDNTGTSRYEAGRADIPLSFDWTFVIVPIPAPSKLIAERGLLTFAKSWEDSFAVERDFWIDEIKFAQLGNVSVTRPMMTSVASQYFLGSTVTIGGTRTVFNIDGAFVTVDHSSGYFDYVSSDPSVAKEHNGTITVVGEGTTTITATLEGADVFGRVTLTGYTPPTEAAADPTVPANQVISLFSGVYQDVNVDTWNADWGMPVQVVDYTVAENTTKMYTSLQWAGILFKNPLIDASEMTHIHLDVFAPAGTDFKVKLVSIVSETVKPETELAFDATTTPAFSAGSWSSLEIPLADFSLPDNWDPAHIGELVISTSDAQLVLVDNVYFHN